MVANRTTAARRKETFDDAWNSVRPNVNTYPKRVEVGEEANDLPTLTPAERSLIAVVHPVVTITKNFVADKKYKQESISLLHSSDKVWAKILPRTDLHNRFMVVERTFKNATKKYMIANPEKVRQWLGYLFANHQEYIRLKNSGELVMSTAAIDALRQQSELAEVLHDGDKSEKGEIEDNDGIVQAAIESGLSKSEMYTFDKFPALYLKSQQILKIRRKGLIEVVEDDSERRRTYNSPANLCFPHLYSTAKCLL
jgi:hypothetical protein